MQINQMTINYMTEPIGYNLDNPVLRYQVSTDTQVPTYHAFEIALDKDFTTIVTAKPKERIDSYCFYPTFILSPRQRYYWRVTVWDENDTCVQSTSWFETGKLAEPWYGQWITPIQKSSPAIDICHSFQLKQPVKTARLYIVGLGVYEAYINDHKIGDEYLTPGYNNYHEWIQYQSYDVTENVQQAQCHLRVMLGNGWYKGNFGFHGGTENIYGDQFLLKAELHVTYQDGETTIISSDDTWQAIPSTVKENSIYYGEDLDLAMCHDKAQAVCLHEGPKGQVTERMSVPVRVQSVESVKHFEQIDTEEWLLDFGQNMVGWVNVLNQLPKGHTLKLEFAETLVNGQFYRENLRAARAAFTFVSDGHAAWLRPHFTFFGFRYVRVTGWPEHLPFDQDSFVGQVVYSSLPVTGSFETSNPKVNRLFENIQWSQKGNFLDVPMDCPQRDERMGWTGDAQIFSQTALYNMAAYPFFRKYLHDMATEQPNFDGAPPMTVPNVPSDLPSSPAAVGVWGDAATIIPWHLYRYYGEKQILEEQYQSMQAWIAYINRKPHVRGLWDRQFQFGDWLALDGDDPDSPVGGTEAKYVANIFYWYSVTILQKTAQIIGRQEEAGIYEQQQRQLKKALKDEYFTPNGRLSIDTQTGYVLALYFELYEEGQSDILVEKLQERLAKDNYHLQTGFVGTPFLNLVLSKYGLSDIAYTLLLNEDYPSWLYAVNMDATTIWERWNSILPDGQMNPLGMNSLNHYAYGAIGQWFYEGVLGINQLSESSGFQKVIISPTIHWSLSSAKGEIETPLGLLKVSWRYIESDLVALTIDVPTLMEAQLVLPDVTWENQEGQTLSEQAIKLVAGENKYYARIQRNQKPHISDQMTLSEILSQPLLSVRAKQVFVGTRLFSSSNLRDHKKQPLSFFVGKNLISSEHVNQFLTQIKAMLEESV